MGPPAVTMACLLLGFLLSTQPGADAQALELNTSFFSEVRVVTVKRYQAQAGQMQLTCRVSSPGRFKAWIKNDFVVGLDAVLTLSASDPNKYGSYFCVADPEVAPNEYRALQFVITEMPPDEKTTEVSATLNRNVSLTCQISSRSGSLRWYKYNDQNFKFEEISGQTGVQLVLSYPQLSREHGSGFTYYKCADPADASLSYQAFKVVKEPVQQMIDGRMTNVYEYGMRAVPTDVASVPISVTSKSKVAFECHKVTPSDSTQWYFRDNSTVSANRYSDLSGQGGVEIQNNPDSSVLSVQNCDVKNKGYYRCVVGDTVKYAFLDIRVVVPTIHEYGKAIYDLARNPGADNELECEIPIGGELKDVIWRIVPSNGSTPVDIPVNRNSGGFETSIKDSGSSQLVTIKFRDNPRFNNYRLECRLGDELDYVTLRSAQPMRISVTVGPSRYSGISFVNCTSDPRLSDIKFHVNDEKNDPINTPVNTHRQESETLRLYYHKTNQPNHWYRCSGVDPSTNTRKYSEPVPLVKDTRYQLDIKIDGSLVSPKSGTPSIAKAVGQRTEFICNFTNYKDLGIRPENVKLLFEGPVTLYRTVQLGPGTFRFVFDNPTGSNSGRYFCIHDVRNLGQRVRSSQVTINWCETNQFMCDNRCQDRNIVCNGVAECADKSDEHPALCLSCRRLDSLVERWSGRIARQTTTRLIQESESDNSTLNCRFQSACSSQVLQSTLNSSDTGFRREYFISSESSKVRFCLRSATCFTTWNSGWPLRIERNLDILKAYPESLTIVLLNSKQWSLTGAIQFQVVSENACPNVMHRCELRSSGKSSIIAQQLKRKVTPLGSPQCLSSVETNFSVTALPAAGSFISCLLVFGSHETRRLPQIQLQAHKVQWNFSAWSAKTAGALGVFSVSITSAASVQSALCLLHHACGRRDMEIRMTSIDVPTHTSGSMVKSYKFSGSAPCCHFCAQNVSCIFTAHGMTNLTQSVAAPQADPEHIKIDLLQPKLSPLTGVIQFRAVSESACPSVRHQCLLRTSINESLPATTIKQVVSKPYRPECLSSVTTQFLVVAQPSVIGGSAIECRLLNGNSVLIELPQPNADARLAGVWERPVLAASSTIAVLAIIALAAVACLFDLRTIRWRPLWGSQRAAVVEEAVKMQPEYNQLVDKSAGLSDDVSGV